MTWQRAAELLESREYEQVARLLREQQEAVQRSGQMTLVIMLAAACQLCLTCRQFQADREIHELGLEKASRREQETRQQIQAVLTMLSQLSSPNGPAERVARPDYAVAEPATIPTETSESGDPSTLFHKVKRLLGFELAPAETAAGLPAAMTEPLNGASQPVGRQPLAEAFNQFIDLTFENVEAAGKSVGPSTVQATEDREVLGLNGSTGRQPAEEEGRELNDDSAAPSLVVYCLGPFQAYLNEHAIEKWPSGKGKSIFKYLVNNRQRPVPKEVLMDLFWPDADPDAARNNLNVAIYGLRQAFRNGDTETSHVLYQNESYLLNPELEIWLDVEEFRHRFQSAQQLERDGFIEEARQEYHVAEALYQGEFLEEDRYEEWLLPLRRQLAEVYQKLLDRLSQYYFDNEEYTSCIAICRSMLVIDSCLEDVHCRLMQCHHRQGQQHLALRQYHQCVNALKEELEVTPGPKIEALYRKLRQHEAI